MTIAPVEEAHTEARSSSIPSDVRLGNLRGVYVANKMLPANDYRVIYPKLSRLCDVTFALPGRPSGVEEDRFIPAPFHEGFRLSIFPHLWSLARSLRRNRGRHHFVHFYSTILILLGPLFARIAGMPSIITVTGLGRTFTSEQTRYRILRPVYNFLMRLAIAASRAVLFQNHTDMKMFAERFPAGEGKYHYIGSAVDATITLEKDFHARPLRVLLVARLLPDKGIAEFLRVAERLSGPTFEFTLVGPPSHGFEELYERVKSAAQNNVIVYPGELHAEEMRAVFEDSHILFFPSFGEGMSRVMLEAAFAQLCPVAYDIPANRDLISEGGGFLVPKGDVDGVVKILERLAADRAFLAKNARAYQAHVVERYDMVSYARRMDGILQQLDLQC